ncbi:MAG: PKD domain-containing protein, partial [Dolichospermum sp.]
PVANFAFTGPDLCSNTTFNFQNTTVSATSYTSYWTYSDGDTSTLENPSHTFAVAGSYTVKLFVQNGNNCKDSITKTVSVLDKPIASFLVNNPSQCLNSNNFNFPNFSTGVGNTYLWKFGDGSTSTTINGNKIYTNAGVYVVELVVTNVNGCKDSVEQTVTVNEKPVSNFNVGGSSICAANLTVAFNNSSTGSGNTYLWYFGDGNTSTATNPTNIYSSIGSYDVKLVTTNANGCKDSVTQTITIGNKPIADFSVNNNAQCLSGNQFTFTNNTSGIFTSSYWDFGDGITSLFTNPSKSYTTAGTYSVKLIVANGNGCKDSINKTIIVADNPIAKFSASGNTSCSSTLNINLNNTSTGLGNTYLWYFGDGVTSTTANPSYTYSASGSYIIRLVVTNSAGCKDSTERSVTFASKPTAAFVTNLNNQCLNNNTFTFTNNSVGGVLYLWNFGDGFTSNAISPTKSYTAAGNYTVKLVVTNASGCKDSTTQLIAVLEKPTANFSTTATNDCYSSLVVGFTNTSSGVGNSYTWNFGTSTTDTSNTVNPTKTYITTGTYSITLFATGLNGCKDTISKTITLSEKAIASFNINNPSQCVNNNNFTFTNTSTGTVLSYFWDFGDGFTSTATNPTKSFTNTGTYTVTLIATHTSGCKDTTSKTVTLLTVPTASFSYTGATSCTNNLTLSFTNTTVGSVSNIWYFGDGGTSTLSNPSKTYASAGTYNVKLVVTNANGC